MQLSVVLILSGIIASAVLAFVVASWLASLREKVEGEHYNSVLDFGRAFFLAFIFGVATTGATIVIVNLQGIDLKMVIGG